jgi:hypothetical protein
VTDPGKRKISGKQILADIRSGMDSYELKRKYDLSDKGFESVCTRLVAARALSENEVRRLAPRGDSSETAPEVPKYARWQCPACNTPQTAEMSECPVCGIVVEKFVARQGHVTQVSSEDAVAMGDASQEKRAGWTPVIVSMVVCALVGGSLLLWSSHRAKEVPKISALDSETQSRQQAGTETGGTQENQGEPEGAGKEYNEVEIVDNQQNTMVPPPPMVALPREAPERTVVAPRENTPALPGKPQYVTGELRRFSSRDFKKEVVEASKTYPVLLQFYSES